MKDYELLWMTFQVHIHKDEDLPPEWKWEGNGPENQHQENS